MDVGRQHHERDSKLREKSHNVDRFADGTEVAQKSLFKQKTRYQVS